MIKSHASQPAWKGKGMSASGSSVMVRTNKGSHVSMHLFTRWQSSTHWMFHSQSYSLHCHRAFSQAKTCGHNQMKKKIIQHLLITWQKVFCFITGVQIGDIYLKLYAVEPICKMKVDDWVFGLTRINANVDFWRCYWFTGRISGVKHMCAPWQSTLFCSKPCWGNV